MNHHRILTLAASLIFACGDRAPGRRAASCGKREVGDLGPGPDDPV